MSRKKDAYWHSVARLSIEYGFKPAQVAKILKSVFPQTEVTGRHIGAYKRRLTTEGVITNVLPTSLVSLNEMISMVRDVTTEEDMFVVNMNDVLTLSETTEGDMIDMYEDYLQRYTGRIHPHHNYKIGRSMGYISTVNAAKDLLEKLYNSN